MQVEKYFFPLLGTHSLLTAQTDGKEARRNAAVWKVQGNRMRTEERKEGGLERNMRF